VRLNCTFGSWYCRKCNMYATCRREYTQIELRRAIAERDRVAAAIAQRRMEDMHRKLSQIGRRLGVRI
jgi:hypothetical protein